MENPRLQNLKEKTLRYNFKIVHVPGVKHQGADATSRHPVGRGEHLEIATHSLTHHNNPPSSQVPDRLSKVLIRNLREHVSGEELEDSLDVKQRTLGLSMTRVAQLKWHEVDSEENSTLAGLNTCVRIKGWKKVSHAQHLLHVRPHTHILAGCEGCQC